MFDICLIGFLIVITMSVLVAHKFFWKNRHKKLAEYFNGSISKSGESVEFEYKGHKFSATRASGSGMSGNGTFGTLHLFLEKSEKFELSLDYLKRLQIKAEEQTKNKILALLASEENLESQLKASLAVTNSTIVCDSRIDVNMQQGLKKVHLLSIYGLSVPYLTDPKTLESEIELLLELSKTLKS